MVFCEECFGWWVVCCWVWVVFFRETGQECEYIFLDINIFPILCEGWGRKQFYIKV